MRGFYLFLSGVISELPLAEWIALAGILLCLLILLRLQVRILSELRERNTLQAKQPVAEPQMVDLLGNLFRFQETFHETAMVHPAEHVRERAAQIFNHLVEQAGTIVQELDATRYIVDFGHHTNADLYVSLTALIGELDRLAS